VQREKASPTGGLFRRYLYCIESVGVNVARVAELDWPQNQALNRHFEILGA
jgi:hypothetical protein